MFKDSKWANEIIALQNENGSWGYFHTLSEPAKHPITTEQALRRLKILGYSIEDAPIQKCVSYMEDCLLGKRQIPDRREKLHNWDIFTNLILATWIRSFTNKSRPADKIANRWAEVIASAFTAGQYDHTQYITAYQNTFGIKPQGGRFVDFVSFYQVSLTADLYDERTESAVFDYILQKDNGIYYIYGKPLSILPVSFTSKTSSRFLGAMELLAKYRKNRYKLQFAVDWLNKNKNENGKWDMGNSVNDKVYFPLSDNWKQKASREFDCTCRIERFINEVSI